MIKIFDTVHHLIRTNANHVALQTLKSLNTGRLNHPFTGYPNHAWYLVGDIYLKMDRFDLAAKAFKKSLHYDEADKNALLALGYCYSENKEPRKAINVLKKGAALFPRDIRIRYNLANAYFDVDNFAAAKELYVPLQKCKDDFISGASKKNLDTIKRILTGE